MNRDETAGFEMVAKTLTGLEELLAAELVSIGAQDVTVLKRAVGFRGDTTLLYRANVECRLATRILVPITSFRAGDRDELYRGVREVDWSEYLDREATFAVDVVVHNSRFKNSHYVALRTKDAIVDTLRAKTGSRPSVDLNNPSLRLNLYLAGTEASLALDSSGDPLHKRAYRREAGAAPLNEVLAAGIVALTGWNGAAPLVDPMCGSGTIVIEAAMKARRIVPGLTRKRYGFMRWKDYDAARYERIIEAARTRVLSDLEAPIVGIDRDASVVRAAQANARRAGVADDVELRCMSLEGLRPPPGPGVVVTNPPYGERLKPAHLRELYTSLGDALKKRYNDYKAYVFTANLEAAKAVGLRTSERTVLFNGPLEGRLLTYELYSGSRKPGRTRPES